MKESTMKSLLVTIMLLLSFPDKGSGVYIKGPITLDTMKKASFDLLKTSETQTLLNIHINSTGGKKLAAENFVATMKALKDKGFTIRCFVTGSAMSAAFYILGKCDLRYIHPSAELMIHDPYYSAEALKTFRYWNYQDSLDHVESVRVWRKEILKDFKVTLPQYEWLAYRDYIINGIEMYVFDETFLDGVAVEGEILCNSMNSCREFVIGYITGRTSVNPIFKQSTHKLFNPPKSYPK